MEPMIKYQYTNFVYPYIIGEEKYEKYLLKLLKDKDCNFKIFQKEKDLDIFNFFLPNVRKEFFSSFNYREDKLRTFNELPAEKKAKILAEEKVIYFTYNFENDIQGKVGESNGIFFKIESIEIICFNTGICFLTLKTHLENTNQFADLLNFNYRFKDINSEFINLKNYEKIRIQTDVFNEVKEISEFINQVTGISYKKNQLEEDKISESFYTYSYCCVESAFWNEKISFENIENNFLKYANVLSNDYHSDFDKQNLEHNLNIVEKLKYSKIAITKNSSNLLCSGIDTYNYTKLPFAYENEYFYLYIFSLYKLIFLRKLNADFKRSYDRIIKVRKKFILFTKEFWNSEFTSDDTGVVYSETLKKTFNLEELYEDIKNKYEVIYKELNIEKNNTYYTLMVILLIFSLIFNTINILFIMYLLS